MKEAVCSRSLKLKSTSEGSINQSIGYLKTITQEREKSQETIQKKAGSNFRTRNQLIQIKSIQMGIAVQGQCGFLV